MCNVGCGCCRRTITYFRLYVRRVIVFYLCAVKFYGMDVKLEVLGTYPLKPLRLLTGEEVLMVPELSLAVASETIMQYVKYMQIYTVQCWENRI